MLEDLFCAVPELTAYCRGLCRSDAAAQDMVQEVFLRAWRILVHCRTLAPASAGPGCTARRATDWRMPCAVPRGSRRPARLEPEPETPDPDFAEENPPPVGIADPAEQTNRKRYLEGYAAAELGKMYGLPPHTVRTRLAKPADT